MIHVSTEVPASFSTVKLERRRTDSVIRIAPDILVKANYSYLLNGN